MKTSSLSSAADCPYFGGPPTEYLKGVLEYIVTLDERPTPAQARAEAVRELVSTFPEAARKAQHDRWTANLLDGRPVASGTSTELRVEVLGLLGWARDRAANGVRNHGAWAWFEAARAALMTYRPSAAPPAHSAL